GVSEYSTRRGGAGSTEGPTGPSDADGGLAVPMSRSAAPIASRGPGGLGAGFAGLMEGPDDFGQRGARPEHAGHTPLPPFRAVARGDDAPDQPADVFEPGLPQ